MVTLPARSALHLAGAESKQEALTHMATRDQWTHCPHELPSLRTQGLWQRVKNGCRDKDDVSISPVTSGCGM